MKDISIGFLELFFPKQNLAAIKSIFFIISKKIFFEKVISNYTWNFSFANLILLPKQLFF